MFIVMINPRNEPIALDCPVSSPQDYYNSAAETVQYSFNLSAESLVILPNGLASVIGEWMLGLRRPYLANCLAGAVNNLSA